MGIIPPGVHRILDYLAVIAFAVAPTVFRLHGNTMYLAYALALVHLIVTLMTHFPEGARRPLAFHIHGAIELLVGILLVCVPLIRHWTFGARRFYIGMGIALLIVWALTRYRYEARVAPSATV
ncbi:MAG: hypothetical protein HOQ11_04380 [Gemmatimonadaceae bacterium]|nr:hypothetical protein [Gemmatimonadaceae bacterium]NUR20015.1 hypothetical protein [Gemmatimonadaceae bacterium]NUS96628.1 hypothetical protein [Gemmatimonadaceae bacterium]